MRKLLLAALNISMLGVLAAPAHAEGYESGSWTVTGYRVGGDGALFRLNPAPVSCGGGTNFDDHIKISDSAPHYAEMFSTLMSAYLTGAQISIIWFHNAGPCSNANVLDTYMVRMKTK